MDIRRNVTAGECRYYTRSQAFALERSRDGALFNAMPDCNACFAQALKTHKVNFAFQRTLDTLKFGCVLDCIGRKAVHLYAAALELGNETYTNVVENLFDAHALHMDPLTA